MISQALDIVGLHWRSQAVNSEYVTGSFFSVYTFFSFAPIELIVVVFVCVAIMQKLMIALFLSVNL